jgi:hypothetical protein
LKYIFSFFFGIASPSFQDDVQVLQALSDFKVGIGGKKYLDYRPMTHIEWASREVQARLLTEHRRIGGWQLLENPLVADDTLYVGDGYVKIDGDMVTAVGHSYPKGWNIQGVYVAKLLSSDKGVDWTKTMPSLDATWTCMVGSVVTGHPCLFVRSVRSVF